MNASSLLGMGHTRHQAPAQMLAWGILSFQI